MNPAGPAKALAEQAPALYRPLRDELAEGVRTPRFRMAVCRQAIMLAGVFVLGWPPLEIAIFFLLEAFLFLSLRAAAEISLDPSYGVVARTPLDVAWQIAKHWLVAAPIMAMLVGVFGAFGVVPAFAEDAWSAFLKEGIRDPSFLGAVVLLAGSMVYDTALFAGRVAKGRSAREVAQDDQGMRLALAKVAVLAMASLFLGLAARVGFGPQALALGIAGTLLFVEALPRRAARLFEKPAA